MFGLNRLRLNSQGGSLGFAIQRALFNTGEQGLWYDNNDLSTLFQDSAGTTPATWGDPIGRQLDKSGNGNHRIQSTAGARPILGRMPKRGAVNLVVSSEDVSATAWTKTRLTTPDAFTVVETVDNGPHNLTQAPSGIVSGLAYTFTVTMDKGLLASAPDVMQITLSTATFGAGQFANVNVNTGEVISVTGATCTSAVSETVTGAWRFTYTATASASGSGGPIVAFCNNNGAATRLPSYAGSTTADCKVYRMQIEQNSVATAYQKVGATAFDVTESGQSSCGYLSFNGSNQWMQTVAAVNFSATDEMAVFAGVRKVSDAATGLAIEHTVSGATNGSFTLAAPSSTGANSYRYSSVGTASSGAGTGVFAAAPDFSVLTGLSDISTPVVTLRRNGAQVETSAATQGTGNYANAVTYFGARAGTSLFFNGLMFSIIIRGALTSGTLLTRTEQYVARQTPTVNL